ncbi:periplasmic chaperone for outer membrane proteins Skp [Roseovarius tolerans]|uniref:Periplasmic chaperone for outer membrane proteins Skp n=1 Tax=Roseovarius tolerans TaxID=74031 RepID=A0A1H7VSP3_9RHOB|nr:OmpH family outer membrane protein [Roseovarius tolerans]SEM11817.1 periplasmic chaperone for outer membrane proteins Skp [Roseovarius tolerans]
MRAGLFRAGVIIALGLGVPQGAAAQQLGVVTSDVIVIDAERLLSETDYGQRLQREIQAERDRLIAYNDRVASDLEAEEQALTEMRSESEPDAFREMADAFDAKVTQLRQDSERMSRELERRRDLAPLQFMRVVQPVLSELLQETEAVVLLDRRSVLLHAEVADVTDLAITRINATVGTGPQSLPEPQPEENGAVEMPELPAPGGD